MSRKTPALERQGRSSLVRLEPVTPRRTVVLVGNPNTGKSTLFNALTGLRQKVANYPGVTVELKLGSLYLKNSRVDLLDLPGMYSLSTHSLDEQIALDALLGHLDQAPRPECVVVVSDASNLTRNLFLVSQVLELGLPVVLALNMMDLAEKNGLEIDTQALERRLRIPVVPLVATTGRGVDRLRRVLGETLGQDAPPPPLAVPEIRAAALSLLEELDGAGEDLSLLEVERALVDLDGVQEQRLIERCGQEIAHRLDELRRSTGQGASLTELEAEGRYQWAAALVEGAIRERPADDRRQGARLDRLLSHPLLGSAFFLLLMTAVFQAVFAWATPVMDLIDAATTWLAGAVGSSLPEGVLASFLADGVIAGVGAVVIFLPQILLLFAFILVLEDTGYMARAAFMIDRLMRLCGLSGQSFIPMLSSFACAVPGIMATRVIGDRRDRLATLLAAPFMTCSARLPVYALLIAAVIPERKVLFGLLNLQGVVLLGLYFVGILAGVTTALLLKRTLLRGPTPSFLLELPPYRLPHLRSLLYRLLQRGRIFLVRAGTIIFTVTVVIWALAYFPRSPAIGERFDAQRQEADQSLAGPALESRLLEIDHQQAAAYQESSFLGRTGKAVEPVFRPLGWDWRVASAVLAAFPAREVVLAALGTIYALGPDVTEDDAGLLERVRSATWPDGRPVFSTAMALGLMVFIALCLQCAATVATITKETGSWRWGAFAWLYMTSIGYLGALLTYQVSSRLLS